MYMYISVIFFIFKFYFNVKILPLRSVFYFLGYRTVKTLTMM